MKAFHTWERFINWLFNILSGILILLYIINKWVTVGFVQEVKLMIVGMTLTVIGIQIIFSAWFLSMIGIEKR